MCHYSGLWDVAYRATPPLPCPQLLATAQSSPLIHIERRLLGPSSFTEGMIQRCQQPLPPRLLQPVPTTSWRLLWDWVSAPHPFSHNPFPVLRASRWQETQQTLTFLVAYYCANLFMLIALLTTGCGVWLLMLASMTVQRVIRPRHTAQLSDRAFRRTPVTLPLVTASFLSLSLPEPLLRLSLIHI